MLHDEKQRAAGIEERDYAVSVVRLISTLSIVLCHVFQYYNKIGLAICFNAGVQVFFFMSGYLLGADNEKNSKWAYRRIQRILLDYWIYLFIVLMCRAILHGEFFGVVTYLNLMVGKTTVQGLEHFWFIRAILMCYFNVFAVDYLITKASKYGVVQKIIVAIIVISWMMVFYIEMDKYWLAIFLAGYVVRKLFPHTKSMFFILITYTVPMTFLSRMRLAWPDISELVNKLWYVCAGGFFFLLIYLLAKIALDNASAVLFKRFLKWFDGLSYDVYITHHYFILGSWCVLGLTANMIVNLIVLFVTIILSAVILRYCSRLLQGLIDKWLEYAP